MKSTPSRFPGLDILRGIMVLIMIIYHGLYLLANVFGRIPPFENGMIMRLFTGIGGAMFVLIAGISAALSFDKRKNESFGKNTFMRYCLKRTAILSILAAVITILTQKFEPDQLILFGILHFFAIGFLLLPVFARFEKMGWILSVSMILFGTYFLTTTFSIDYLWIFGVRKAGFMSADYYPLLPYFGVLLLGFSVGKWLIEKVLIQKIFAWDIPGGGLIRWFGTHSLLIYLIHVPVMYGVFWLIF